MHIIKLVEKRWQKKDGLQYYQEGTIQIFSDIYLNQIHQ